MNVSWDRPGCRDIGTGRRCQSFSAVVTSPWLLFATFIVILVSFLLFAPGAHAVEVRPLKIVKFSMQSTRTHEVVNPITNKQEPLSHENWGFANEPVTFVDAAGHLDGLASGADSLTTSIEFETEKVARGPDPRKIYPVPTRDPKDIAVTLPEGLLGNPIAVPRCLLRTALSTVERCPGASQVGVAVIRLQEGEGLVGPIVNVVPETGQSAEFAVETNSKLSFVLTGHVVRKHEVYGEVYGLVVDTNSIPMSEIYRSELSFWGVPASKIHDPERGLLCGLLGNPSSNWDCGTEGRATGGEVANEPEVPFFTMPSDCAAGPETATIRADSWEEPGRYVEQESETVLPTVLGGSLTGFVGCDVLPFSPSVGVQPDTKLADAPVGLGVNLKVPQIEEPERAAVPELHKSVLTFPLGMSVSPGVVDGVQACNESGPEGINFTGPESEEIGLNGEPQLAPGHCPDASTLGTVEAETPLLEAPVKGHIYLARPGCGNAALAQRECTEQDAADGNLYQLYLELGGTGALANAGVNIKMRLKTLANLATGQLTSVTDEIAQLPFSELRVRLNGGPRAPLDNPPVCGPAVTSAHFTSWASPGVTPQGVFVPGLPDATPSSLFDVEGCSAPVGLSPGFLAGTVTADAGKFSPFTLNLSRKDREQYIKGVQVHTPSGLAGVLASVPLCSDAQANAGTCPETSKIGTTRVASGAGSHPFEIEGSMYLTGPHDGAPFGLSIVTNAVAGPFNLGKVIVRSRIDIDPHDASLTITTDETGPFALPQIIFGIPIRLQRITVNVDRSNFMFNPTNCMAKQITARVSGSQGAVASVESPFAVGACKSLAFKPKFTVSTNGHTSRAKGASLDVKLSYPKGAMGNDANIARVKVSLPRQLPSRLETLKKACPVETFEKDPAACSKASIVGVANSTTPILPVKLQGPAYFVSHGSESYPQLVIVLQGEGIRVDLVGNTSIYKGITTSIFKNLPDVPVGTFELRLPQGKFSALAANGRFCHEKNRMIIPAEFTAQNGAVFRQKTKINATGCGKPQKRRRGRR
jgi:hypothetical protein